MPSSVRASEASAAGIQTIEHLTGVLLEDIRNTLKINSVVIDGRYYPREALDQMLDAVARLQERSNSSFHSLNADGVRQVDLDPPQGAVAMGERHEDEHPGAEQ